MTTAAPTIPGRDQELAALDADLAGVGAGRHALTVVRGPEGIGRTTFLDALDRSWRARGVRVLSVAFRDALPHWDEFGATPVLAAVRERFEEFGDGRLAAAVNTVHRLCRPATYRSRRDRFGLLTGLAGLFARVGEQGHPVALLADDVDALRRPWLAIAPAHRPGCLVVATYTDGGEPRPGIAELDSVADRVRNLGPLPENCLHPLLAGLTGTVPDEHLVSAMRAALGPFSRHPATLTSTVDTLRRDEGLVVVHGRTCLAGGQRIALPAGHRLVGHVGPPGATGHHLVVLAATCDRFGIDDLPVLAAATGRTTDDYGRTVDRLVALGALECAPDGRLSCPCPALAERIVTDLGPHAAALHRAVAERLPDGPQRSGAGTALTDHIALAGTRLPADPGHARRLVGHARRVAVRDPERALIWCRAALHHAVPAERRAVLADLARLSLRTGDYGVLLGIADTEPLDTELAAAVAVAALQLARPVPEAVRAALPEAARFGDRWLAGEPVDVRALLSWCAAGNGPTPHSPASTEETEEFAEAAETADLAELFRLMLGCAPTDTPMTLHHRVVHGYRTGDWPGVLSAARRLELAGCPNLPLLSVTRLLAAEVCAEQGDPKHALAWLAAAGTGERDTALRGWVDSGMRWRAGAHGDAFDAGWHAYQRAPALRHVPGRDRLLARLAVIAVDGDLRGRAEQVHTEVEGLGRQAHPMAHRQFLQFVRGVVGRDLLAAQTSAELARRRGHLPGLLAACLLAGELADVAHPWLYEAHGIARRLGTASPQLRRLMHTRGISVPRGDVRAVSLSDTESCITELICDGRTNRQIATELRLSEKAVEYHLSRLFARTGSRTRAGLAAAAAKG